MDALKKIDLPNDPDKLKDLVIQYDKESKFYKQEFELLRRRIFNRKSEALKNDKQAYLFDEAEVLAEKEKNDSVVVKSHRRRKRGRKPISDKLPRKEIIIDIAEEEKTCACGHELVKIGEEVSERQEYIPARVYVEKTIRPKYACHNCEGSSDENKKAVKIASAPPVFIKGSVITERFLAHVLVSKFCDHLPYYRQEKIYKRLEITLNRNTMSNLQIAATKKLKIMENLFIQELLSGPFIHIDETGLQVMKEESRKNSQGSYMFIFRGGNPDRPVVYYHYSKTRSAKFLNDFLKDYKGVIITDGWASYNVFARENNITHAACWAHVRRKYYDYKEMAKIPASDVKPLYLIGRLYR